MKANTSAMAAEPLNSSKPLFPFLHLRPQHAKIADEIRHAIEHVMESQQFILGPEVDAFEQEVKAQVSCQYAIGCASGSDALLLALMALQVGPRNEVIARP